MTRWLIACLSLSAWAADRYVALNGADTGACTNIAAPCLTLEYADNQSAAGDTIYVRGGRYTTTAATFITPSVAATASARLTVRSYPGEAVIFDCEGVSGRRFANFTVAGIGYYTFAALGVINVHSSYGPVLAQGTHPGIELRGVRMISTGFGITINPLTLSAGHRIVGSLIENGLSTSLDCSSQSGAANGDYVGCTDMIVQDTVFRRTAGSGSDHVGMEAGHNILFSRVTIYSPPVAGDCLDIKANDVTLEDISVIGCSAKGATVWGYGVYRHVLTDGVAYVMGEYTARDIDGAVDDGGFIRITASYSPYGGQVPIPGHRVTIANVLGCTGANGTWTIKDAQSKDVFRIMGANGEGTSCGGVFEASPSSSVRMAAPVDRQYGADVRHSTFRVGGGAAVQMLYGMTGAIPWSMYDSILDSPAASGSVGICASSAGPIRSSNRNQFYTGRGQAYATGYSGGATCSSYDGANLATNEPASHFGPPALDTATYRATASSPASLANRGYYAGTNTVEAGEDAQIIRWRAPSASDTCTVDLDDAADFATPLVTLTSQPGPRWRELAFGSLAASTPYYHRITCGYDVMTGSASTTAAISGTAPAVRALSAPVDSAQSRARMEYWTGSSWAAGPSVSCSSGCVVQTADLQRGQVYSVRHARLSSSDQVLGVSEPRPVVIP